MKKLTNIFNKYNNMSYRINMYQETYGIKVLEFINNKKQLGISVRIIFDTELEKYKYTISKYILVGTNKTYHVNTK